MSTITPIMLPEPIEWAVVSGAAQQHIEQLTTILNFENNQQLYQQALNQVCSEESIQSRKQEASYWQPYQRGEQQLTEFFTEWLTFTPSYENPGLYIEYWDYLVNTDAGLILVNETEFKPWFRAFLNYHGDWINSTSSTQTLASWMTYKGSAQHPFNINDYEQPIPMSPTGGFESFNQFFLRNLKPEERPMCPTAGPDTVVAPCDGGVFFLNDGQGQSSATDTYPLPGKVDNLQLIEAIPQYGERFVGGQLLDILLWFTDYHHFHAPVSGTVIEQGLYHGSYNYDFGDYQPQDNYAPNRPAGSDRVGWYQKLGKHQRYVWVIQTEDMGLVAMIAIGFWGVGSIINHIQPGAHIEKGEYMGHFGYGGSSIVLAFEPGQNFDFSVGGEPVSDPDHPVLMKVRECLGTKS